MEKTDAVSIAIFIKRIILRMSFDSEKLQGQCYDDCATMMGKKKGVDTQIKNDISKKNNLLHYLPIATHTMWWLSFGYICSDIPKTQGHLQHDTLTVVWN